MQFLGNTCCSRLFCVVSKTVAKKVLLGVLRYVLPRPVRRVRWDPMSGAYHSNYVHSMTQAYILSMCEAQNCFCVGDPRRLPGRVFPDGGSSVSLWGLAGFWVAIACGALVRERRSLSIYLQTWSAFHDELWRSSLPQIYLSKHYSGI